MVRLRERQNWHFRSDTPHGRNGLIHFKANTVPGKDSNYLLLLCFFRVFSPKKPPCPIKIAIYLIAKLDFQALNFKKAQFTLFNTACLEYRYFRMLT